MTDMAVVITVSVVLLITISAMIIATTMGAVFAARRHRMFFVLDRVQQLLTVAKLAANDPDYSQSLIYACKAHSSQAYLSIVLDCLYNPHERNVIEGIAFHHLHPEFTAEQAMHLVITEVQNYQRKISQWSF